MIWGVRELFLLVAAFYAGCPSSTAYDYVIKQFDVHLDHFGFTTNATFPIRYLVNDSYWKPDDPAAPIFFYTGNEGNIKMFAENTGFLWETAPEFKALIIFAEHRYYGESLPFGDKSYTDPKYSGYLSSMQALTDYVELIAHVKETYGKGRKNIPVIAFGGSYGGMLASWMRMKYPSVITGALASSAPIWQFTGMTPCNVFNKVLTSAYRQADSRCPKTIKKSWGALNRLGKTKKGLQWITKTFKLCDDLTDVADLKDWLIDVYSDIGMVNYPYSADFLAPLPGHPVKVICKRMHTTANEDETILESIVRGLDVYTNYTGTSKCVNLSSDATEDLGEYGWEYQSCTEMVMPMCDHGDDMFEKEVWDINETSEDCYQQFQVRPQVNYVRDMYGGKNIHSASNIIFSNGLLDPWSGGGVLNSLSETAVAVVIPESAHHLDLRAANQHDPESIKKAREYYKVTFKTWIANSGMWNSNQ